MNIIKYTSILCLLVFFGSCEKVIEFDGETKTPKIVVNSLFNTEDTFSVHLSNSLALVDDGDLKPLKKASLKLYNANGDLVSSPTHVSDGYYMDNDFSFLAGEEYKLVVENESFSTVETTSQIPEKVLVNRIDSQDVTNSEGWEQKQIELTFNDPVGTNYYMVEVKMKYIYKYDTIFYSGSESAYINTLDPNVVGRTGNGAFYDDKMILSDKRFDGKEYTFRFNLEKWVLEEGAYKSVEIKFYSLSEAAYNYFTSLQRYREVQGDFFATPVQVYSNVEGGFGIFGGAAIESYPLK